MVSGEEARVHPSDCQPLEAGDSTLVVVVVDEDEDAVEGINTLGKDQEEVDQVDQVDLLALHEHLK